MTCVVHAGDGGGHIVDAGGRVVVDVFIVV